MNHVQPVDTSSATRHVMAVCSGLESLPRKVAIASLMRIAKTKAHIKACSIAKVLMLGSMSNGADVTVSADADSSTAIPNARTRRFICRVYAF